MTPERLTIYDYLDIVSIGIFYDGKTYRNKLDDKPSRSKFKFSMFLLNLVSCFHLVLSIPLMMLQQSLSFLIVIIIISVFLIALLNSVTVNHIWLINKLDKIRVSYFFDNLSKEKLSKLTYEFEYIDSGVITLPWWMFKIKYNISPAIYLSREGYDQ